MLQIRASVCSRARYVTSKIYNCGTSHTAFMFLRTNFDWLHHYTLKGRPWALHSSHRHKQWHTCVHVTFWWLRGKLRCFSQTLSHSDTPVCSVFFMSSRIHGFSLPAVCLNSDSSVYITYPSSAFSSSWHSAGSITNKSNQLSTCHFMSVFISFTSTYSS